MLHQLPAFRTRRLTVRPRTIDDLEACMAMDHDTEVTRFLPGPWTILSHIERSSRRMRHAYAIAMGCWSVMAAEEFVGWILLTPLDLHASEIEIGWRFLQAAWGRCFATEAARPELDHALNILGLAQVIADIDPANMAWANLARKPGFRPAGSVRCNGHAFPRYVAFPSAGQK